MYLYLSDARWSACILDEMKNRKCPMHYENFPKIILLNHYCFIFFHTEKRLLWRKLATWKPRSLQVDGGLYFLRGIDRAAWSTKITKLDYHVRPNKNDFLNTLCSLEIIVINRCFTFVCILCRIPWNRNGEEGHHWGGCPDMEEAETKGS